MTWGVKDESEEPERRNPESRPQSRRGLFERERELAVIDDVISAAAAGHGRSLLIDGPPGIGKSRLLEGARMSAKGAGMRVLSASGSELERDLELGVVRQLLGSALPEELPLTDLAMEAPPLHATLDRLYRIVAGQAVATPLMIAVDDIQAGDQGSLLWLSYLARRLSELPVLVVLAATWTARGRARQLVEALGSDPATYVLRPAALSTGAVEALVTEALAAVPDPEFVAACHAATGGNPFLVHTLLSAVRAAGVAGTATDAHAVSSIGPQPVAGHVLRRLAGVEAPAEALLRAAAILGDGADPRQAAALAGLHLGQAAAAADALVCVDVLQPRPTLAFTYPIVRAAIYSDLEGSYKAAAHKRAARLLRSDPATLDAVARHLVSARRAGDPWVVERLRAAATRALERGSTADAAAYLRRALDEPPEHRNVASVLFELGSAEARTGVPIGIERLYRALEIADNDAQRATIALELARQLTAAVNSSAALAVLDRVLADDSTIEAHTRRRLEAAQIRAQMTELARARGAGQGLARAAQRLADGEEQDPGLMSALALSGVARGDSPERSAAFAARALAASRRVVDEDHTALASAVIAFAWLDAFDVASQVCSETLAGASASGSVSLAATALCLRSHVAFRRGAIDQAEQDVRAALDMIGEGWGRRTLVYPTAFLIDALIERGELAQAADLIGAPGFAGDLPESWEYNHLLDSRSRLRLAQHRYQEALDDIRECGRRLEAWRVKNPGVIAWRSTAALALTAMNERDEALALANEELLLARQADSQRAFGVALRAAGIAQRGSTGIELLEEAVGSLEKTGAQLELARTLLELGALLQREGRASVARARASTALDIALRIGATTLARRARDELVTSGARPRRFARRGLDALTARQREVAELAGRGRSNREIAEELVVSENTVETHLRLAFRKLEVSSRAQLGELFEAGALATELESQ